jgi:hypothetical protein
MAATTAGPEIERLIALLARLPGLGPRSARRAALFLIKKREQIMAPLTAAMQTAFEKIEICRLCGTIDTLNPCAICIDVRRDPAIIIVVGMWRISGRSSARMRSMRAIMCWAARYPRSMASVRRTLRLTRSFRVRRTRR